MEEAHERKLAKYQDLVEECRSRGWRGFAGRSICKALAGLGVTGAVKPYVPSLKLQKKAKEGEC